MNMKFNKKRVALIITSTHCRVILLLLL